MIFESALFSKDGIKFVVHVLGILIVFACWIVFHALKLCRPLTSFPKILSGTLAIKQFGSRSGQTF